MTHVPGILLTAAGAFVATNIDDFAVLLLIVMSAPAGARIWPVTGGQYLGFAVLVAVSVAGAAALHAVPLKWAGLLGAVPVALGIWGLLRLGKADGEAGAAARADSVIAVALLTIAGGADNISVYVPLLRRLDVTQTALTLTVFAVLLAVWCAAALLAGHYARLVPGIVRAGRWLSPCLYIALGVIILLSTGAVTHLA